MGYLTEQLEIGRIRYYMNASCGMGSLKSARPGTRSIELEVIVNGWAWYWSNIASTASRSILKRKTMQSDIRAVYGWTGQIASDAILALSVCGD